MKGLLMKTSLFISRSACSRRRPSLGLPHLTHARPHLISELMKERSVARFVVAPFGYGKTCLVAEYAETIHYWSHVFWINCQSPCFLRDLDAGVIFESCIAADSEAALVIFEDLPDLSESRSESFSALIDLFLEKECEVVVTCIPSHDRFERLQKDRICLSGQDLILSEQEYDETRSSDEINTVPAHQVVSSKRIPCFVWESNPDIGQSFMSGIMQEKMPSDAFRTMITMLIFGEGDLLSLDAYAHNNIDNVIEELLHYPHLGVNEEQATFHALRLELEFMRPFLRKYSSRLIGTGEFESFELLVSSWAESLMIQNNHERACELVRLFLSPQSRDAWLFAHVSDLISHACFMPLMNLLSEKHTGSVRDKSRFVALKAFLSRVLGCRDEALLNAKISGFSDTYPAESLLLGLLTLSRLGSAIDSERIIDGMLKAIDSAPLEQTKSVIKQEDYDLLFQLTHARLVLFRGLEGAMKQWSVFFDQKADYRLLCIMSSWILEAILENPELKDDTLRALFEKMEHYIHQINDEISSQNKFDYFALLPLAPLVKLWNINKASTDKEMSPKLSFALQKIETKLFEQGREYRRQLLEQKIIKEDWDQTHHSLTCKIDQYESIQTQSRTIPQLYIKTFGGFEVMIENDAIDYVKFKRHNTRALLALLALNHGKEISRELVSEAMWPNSPSSIAHKNFYTVWSDLRKVLTLPDGTCPYLVRHQYGCSLNMKYVKTDVEKFDEICRGLIFDINQFDDWSSLFHKIETLFAADFMPSEHKNLLIVRARNDCRSRLVDALVAASVHVVSADSPQLGVWFARLAVNRDDMREDAYVALMKAQIAVNQRTAAMMTYLHCRKELSEKLGIDPSPETTKIYEDLLHYNSVSQS